MPLVTDNTKNTGFSVEEIIAIMGDELGVNPENNRFKATVKRWVQRAINDVQLHDPENRTTIVHDAEATIKKGATEIDVRLSVDNGGFAFDNCVEILDIVVPEFSDLTLDTVGLGKFRNRGEALTNMTGPPHAVVLIDKVRIRIDPAPDKDYEARVDYKQALPKITTGRISWTPYWDSALLEGVSYYAAKVYHAEFPAKIGQQKRAWEAALANLAEGEKLSAERPRRAITTRALRSRRYIPHDNSTDIRIGRYRY